MEPVRDVHLEKYQTQQVKIAKLDLSSADPEKLKKMENVRSVLITKELCLEEKNAALTNANPMKF